MVLCLIVGCSKRSGRDKNVSFYRIPKVITRKGPRIEELSRRRRTGFISAFTRGKNQLSALEVEESRSIANVRIHVERVIGNVRQKYSILKGTIPLNFLSVREDEDFPMIDRITRVSCALCNLCDSVIPFD